VTPDHHFNSRLGALRRAVALRPDSAEAHYSLGLALRMQGALSEAIQSYRRAIELRPDSADQYNNLGDALQETRRYDDAIAAYRKALALRPAFVEASYNLATALQDSGRLDESITAYRQTLRLAPALAEAHNNLGNALSAAGRKQEAINAHKQAFMLYCDACRTAPAQPRFQFMAGISAWNAGLHDQAGIYLREAVRLQPTDHGLHYRLADWCLDRGDFAGALRHSARALELGPDDPQSLVCRALVLEAHGRLPEAWDFTQRLLKTPFRSAKLGALYARLAPGTGQERAALHEIDRLIGKGGLAASDNRLLRLAAATLLDRLGRFDDAFASAQAGHVCEADSYDPARIERLVQCQIEYFTPAKLHDLPRASIGSRRPVFIIGMPRSGTSLVEQILASHPQVYGTGELKAISNILEQLDGPASGADGYPQCLDRLTVLEADRHASTYLHIINELNQTASFVTDKMPTNFLSLGIIATLFPDAHVIHCTRNALDTCISCYLTNFAAGHDVSRNLEHLGAYYRQYRRLMNHWTRNLNFPMLEVRYEDVVADQPGQSRRMLEFLGLQWDDRCAAFHKTARQVKTASFNQVNQPIYSTSVNRWQNYARHLAPLRAALGEHAD
jgi:tetratricopeptide (TPR) repeat protein